MKKKSFTFLLAFLLIGCGIKNTNIIVKNEIKEEGEASQEQSIKLQEVNSLIEQREECEDNFKQTLLEEAKEEEYFSEIEIIKMSEDERRELFEKYSPLTGMILRNEEDRIQNTFFFPAGQKEVDMTVRYDNWNFLMVNGDANDPLYDKKNIFGKVSAFITNTYFPMRVEMYMLSGIQS